MVDAGTIVICAVAYSLKSILSVLPFFSALYLCAGKAETKELNV